MGSFGFASSALARLASLGVGCGSSTLAALSGPGCLQFDISLGRYGFNGFLEKKNQGAKVPGQLFHRVRSLVPGTGNMLFLIGFPFTRRLPVFEPVRQPPGEAHRRRLTRTGTENARDREPEPLPHWLVGQHGATNLVQPVMDSWSRSGFLGRRLT